MSIQIEKKDQTTIIKLASDFIEYYYTNLNERNYDQIGTLILMWYADEYDYE